MLTVAFSSLERIIGLHLYKFVSTNYIHSVYIVAVVTVHYKYYNIIPIVNSIVISIKNQC